LSDGDIVPQHQLHALLNEANELVAIVVASRKTPTGRIKPGPSLAG
jgi:hypothetical protein